MLAELAVEAMGRRAELRPNGETTVEEEAKRRVSEWIDEYGWPTGARFVRGSHSGTYRADLWGRDKPDGGYGFPKPTYPDLLADEIETVKRERAKLAKRDTVAVGEREGGS
jgi:hypothetical protein